MGSITATTTITTPASVPDLKNVTLLEQSPYLVGLMTILRNAETDSSEFGSCVDRVARLVVASALSHVPTVETQIKTPTGVTYTGRKPAKKVCGVSVLRAGASMESALRECWAGPLSFGKLLVQRDERTYQSRFLYSKLPPRISEDVVLLLEPMLATGGSITKVVEILIEKGVAPENIVLANVVASKQGLDTVVKKFPDLKIVTAALDPDLTPSKFISPGLGDFGDRYYGTVE
ncbi:hypothetical protein MPDQ_004923 [Monascus purpureus]|uniref:uracil phosphoribosyltransferase n=1 Tax=Monascus purpureus TaxID=5098 RepID=A0A507QJA6_MONPU|nr:hypothetical protein MPDQ_004923 [Monascus purpureus]